MRGCVGSPLRPPRRMDLPVASRSWLTTNCRAISSRLIQIYSVLLYWTLSDPFSTPVLNTDPFSTPVLNASPYKGLRFKPEPLLGEAASIMGWSNLQGSEFLNISRAGQVKGCLWQYPMQLNAKWSLSQVPNHAHFERVCCCRHFIITILVLILICVDCFLVVMHSLLISGWRSKEQKNNADARDILQECISYIYLY